MKRKYELIEESDTDVEPFDKNQVCDEGQKASTSKRKKIQRLFCINVAIILSIFLIPLIAIKSMNHEPFMNTIEKIIGEKCSHNSWVPKNLSLLRDSLNDNLFGQHIAKNVILSSFSRRWNSKIISYNKPLVMSFHGWTGELFLDRFIQVI